MPTLYHHIDYDIMDQNIMSKKFAIIGCSGYIAPKHLEAISETGNTLIAAFDINDSAGSLDKHFSDAVFFKNETRFKNYIKNKVDYVSICSPNYLHKKHISLALKAGAHAICEKPLVINPKDIDKLKRLEKNLDRKIFPVLQLRLHPEIKSLKKMPPDKKTKIVLKYITPRGNWYLESWKGSYKKSGGLPANIGIHFFDMLIWIFGNVEKYKLKEMDSRKISGTLELERATVEWFLSIDKNDLPPGSNGQPLRIMRVNNRSVDFSSGFTDLHTELYKDILSGTGPSLEDARPAIDLVTKLMNEKI